VKDLVQLQRQYARVGRRSAFFSADRFEKGQVTISTASDCTRQNMEGCRAHKKREHMRANMLALTAMHQRR
jgi:hypothetical protein